jgi:hypothetical protein
VRRGEVSARNQLARFQNDLQRAANPSKRQRKGRPPQPLGAAEQAQIDALTARLADLSAQEAALAQGWPTAADRLGPLHTLAAGYRDLQADARALWRAACPDAYAADLARQRAAEQSYASHAAGSSYTPEPSSSASSSDSSGGSYGGGGGESRAGGDW